MKLAQFPVALAVSGLVFGLGPLQVTAASISSPNPSTLSAAQSELRTVQVGAAKVVHLSPRSPTPPEPPIDSAGRRDLIRQRASWPGPALIESPSARRSPGRPQATEARPGLAALSQPLAAGTDLVAFRNTTLATTVPGAFRGIVGEPSVSNNGNVVFYTGNWYAAVSADSGSTFTYRNPYTDFPAAFGGFCCDQVTIYDPSRNITVWELLYRPDLLGNNVIRLAVANGKDGVTRDIWHYWDVTAQMLGFQSGLRLDYPQLALRSNTLYVTANVFNSAGAGVASTIMRFPLDPLALRTNLAFDVFITTLVDTLTPAWGGGSIMYFAAHLTPTTLRVYSLSESSLAVNHTDVVHSSFVPMAPGFPPGWCPSPDGHNMCGRNDSRVKTGWVAGGFIGFMWDAAQGTGGLGSFPYPYVHAVRIQQATMTLIDEPILWSNATASAYPSVAVNGRGHLGLSFAFGGGAYYPSSAVGIRDDVSGESWQVITTASGTNGPGTDKWGDYLTVRPASGTGNTWVATGYTLQGGATASAVEPRFFWFGRQRDDPLGAPAVNLNPSGLAFGSQRVGLNGAAQIVSLTNSGAADLLVSAVGIAGTNASDFVKGADTCAGATVPARGVCTISVSFTPTSVGSRSATLSIADGAPGSPHLVPLSGTGILVPGVPTGVAALPGSASAMVSWLAPTDNGGSPVTTYTVTASPGGSTATAGGDATLATVTSLTNGATYTFTVQASNAAGTGPASAPSNAVIPRAEGNYNALTPARILDTRDGTGEVPAAPIGQAATLNVQITGRGGVPRDRPVSAVVLNVTVTNPTAAGFLTVYPTGVARPLASNLNFTAGQTVPNLVEVALGAGGKVTVFNSAGATDVIFDVAGWVSTQGTLTGTAGLFRPLVPARLLDTRIGAQTLGPAQTTTLLVAGKGLVPPAGVSGVVLNVTVTNPSAVGFLTVFPTGAPQPLASNLNFVPGQTVPNRVQVKLGTGGQVSLFNSAGTTDVIVDVGGWFTDGTDAAATGGQFTGLTPVRILDTRVGTGGVSGPVGPSGTIRLTVAGQGNVPAMTAAVPPKGVVLNVTVTNTSNVGFLTVFPSDATPPLASDLNWTAGLTVPNLVVVKLGADGKVALFNSAGTTDVIADVVGWYN